MCIAIISTYIATIAKYIATHDFSAQIGVEVSVPSITLKTRPERIKRPSSILISATIYYPLATKITYENNTSFI